MNKGKGNFILLVCIYTITLSVWAQSYCYLDPGGIKRISVIKISQHYTVCSPISDLPINIQHKVKIGINPYTELYKKRWNSASTWNKLKEHSETNYLIRAISHRYNVDPKLVKAIIAVESGYNPNAVSSRGALGLMQLMPATAKELAENARLDLKKRHLLDPKINIHLGVRYLSELATKYNNNIELMLAAYHAGTGNVARYNNKVPPFSATQRYIHDVICRYKDKYASYDKSIFCKF